MSPIFIGCGIVTVIGPIATSESFEPRYTAAVRRTARPGSVRMRSVKRMSRLSVRAAVEAGHCPDGGSDHRRENRDEQCDPERRPDPVDDSAQVVAAELIGAEDVPAFERRWRGETGRRIDVVEVDLVEFVGRDLLREDRDEREEDQDDESDDSHLVAEEAHARVRPLTTRFDLDAGLVREVGVRYERAARSRARRCRPRLASPTTAPSRAVDPDQS